MNWEIMSLSNITDISPVAVDSFMTKTCIIYESYEGICIAELMKRSKDVGALCRST